MANNPFDPPIVQVKKTLSRGGIATVNRGYGSLKSSTTRTRQAPPADQAEWWPENLADLDDVDVVTVGPTIGQTIGWDGVHWVPKDALDIDMSTPPTSGQALLYNDVTEKWVPGSVSGGGGVPVGTWENDKTVTFTVAGMTETYMQGSPINITNVKPVSPTHTLTLTSGDMPTASDAADPEPLGFKSCLYQVFSVNHTPASSLNATLAFEVIKNGVTVIATQTDAGHTQTERGTVAFYDRDANEGDSYEFRIWFSAGTYNAGPRLDWRAYGVFPSRFGRSTPPLGGVYLYRDIQVLGTSPAWTPSTVLTNIPTWAAGTTGFRVYDNGTYLATSTDANRTYVGSNEMGIVCSRGYDNDTAAGTVTTNATVYNAYIADAANTRIETGSSPLQIRVDRISVPSIPS